MGWLPDYMKVGIVVDFKVENSTPNSLDTYSLGIDSLDVAAVGIVKDLEQRNHYAS